MRDNMITLTNSAIEQIKHVKTIENKPNYALRVSVSGGGCSGLSYKLDFDESVRDNDKIFEQDGVKIVTDPKSFLYVSGMTLDFSSGLNGKGFVFNNPNAKKSCGCGSSFAT